MSASINPFPLIGRWVLVMFTMLCVQVGFLNQFTIIGVTADILLPMAICAGLVGGAQRGAIVGFWFGLIFDLLRQGPVGVSALTYCVVAFVAGLVQVALLQSSRAMSMVIVGVSSGVGVLFFAVSGTVFGNATLSNPDLWRIVVVVGVTSGLISRVCLKLADWAEGPEARSVAN